MATMPSNQLLTSGVRKFAVNSFRASTARFTSYRCKSALRMWLIAAFRSQRRSRCRFWCKSWLLAICWTIWSLTNTETSWFRTPWSSQKTSSMTSSSRQSKSACPLSKIWKSSRNGTNCWPQSTKASSLADPRKRPKRRLPGRIRPSTQRAAHARSRSRRLLLSCRTTQRKMRSLIELFFMSRCLLY